MIAELQLPALSVPSALLAVPQEEMSMSSVIEIPREELVARRDSILRRLGTTRDAFHELAITKVLSGDEWEALEHLDAINFLLGDESSPDAR